MSQSNLDFSLISELVSSRLESDQIPSLTVGVLVKGELVYGRAFGFADRESKLPATMDTTYSLASITKPMVATLLAMASERGQIDLSASASGYLGPSSLTPFIGTSRGATVERLLNHTSGLPLHYQFSFDGDGYPLPDMPTTLRRYGNLVRSPGSKYLYSNLGYGFLGQILENVLERPLRELLAEELFGPLDMANAFFDPLGASKPNYAVRYDQANQPLPHYRSMHPGGSDAYASANDLMKFGQFHLEQSPSTLLSVESRKRMAAPITSASIDQTYGLGWGLGQTVDGARWFGHSGSMDGVTTQLQIFPSHDAVIVVLCNCASELVSATLAKLREAIGIHLAAKTETAPKSNDPRCQGTWKGWVRTYVRDVPLEIALDWSGTHTVRLDGVAVDAELKVEACELLGTINGEMDTPDAKILPHTLSLDMSIVGGSVHGAVTARLQSPNRIGHALSYPAVLRR